jgi:hypothetical protein
MVAVAKTQSGGLDMPISACAQKQFEKRRVATKYVDLAEDGHYLELYKSYPYFVDVIEWVQRIRPIEAIRHNHNYGHFQRCVLPRILERLREEGFLRVVGGVMAPVYADVILRTDGCDAVVVGEVAQSQLDTLLRRALDTRKKPKLDVVRTKASPEQIRDWRRQLIHIFEEIEDHDDPEGVSFTLNMLSLQESIETSH